MPWLSQPPLYTNNKLPWPKPSPRRRKGRHPLDVLPIFVGTDPGLALRTRKGTEYYKVPSLKGVWYRATTCMMESVASLEGNSCARWIEAAGYDNPRDQRS